MEKEKMVIDIIKTSTSHIPAKVKKENAVLRKIPFDLGQKYGLLSEAEYNELIPYIKEFQLDNPKKLINWVVDLNFAAIESINDGIDGIRKDLLKNEIDKIGAIKLKINNFSKNDNRQMFLKMYADELVDIIVNLNGKTETYLSEIIKIDNLPRFEFFLKANFNKSKVDNAVINAKAALEAFFNAISIYSVIQCEREKGASDEFNTFIDLVEEFDISYFIAYDKNKSDFWDKEKMIERIKIAQSTSMTIQDFLLSEQETEVDFEDDIDYEN